MLFARVVLAAEVGEQSELARRMEDTRANNTLSEPARRLTVLMHASPTALILKVTPDLRGCPPGKKFVRAPF